MNKKIFSCMLASVATVAATMSFSSCTSTAEGEAARILMNQVAFYPNSDKEAILDTAYVGPVEIYDASGNRVMKVNAIPGLESPFSGQKRSRIVFSDLKTVGDYELRIGKNVKHFAIREDALRDATRAALKAFYYQRSGVELEERYAGKWARPMGHPDTQVMVHPTAATKKRPAGTIISSPFGWYDAGDYNKYIVNSAYSIGVMFQMYEMIPEYFAKLDVNIPESGDDVPDLLDEIYFNLKWMVTMQDTDGGLYHKLTTPNFEGFIMPTECQQQRYVVQKTVTASYDYAACMAMASRIYSKYEEYSEFAKTAIESAKRAYEWAKANPTAFYTQSANNEKYDPDVTTGEYGDGSAADEQMWAAVELYLTTGDESYIEGLELPSAYGLNSWGNVASLAQWEMISKDALKETEASKVQLEQFKAYIETLREKAKRSDFSCAYGAVATDFHWGCLSEGCCNAGAELLRASYLLGEEYSDCKALALANADYMLGRNPMDNCYVTGLGVKSTMYPHHRISHADSVEEPIPGLLAGGPNPGKQDGLNYPIDYPDMCYLDDMNSYASNEIAINWNASLVAFLAAVDEAYSVEK
ncbi:MAG: glycoside hydrolase family 9 protein [Bacteroidia bacterium]|nr:glycoside hydrolase family 9 protein [Bacteroidia bacterium]